MKLKEYSIPLTEQDTLDIRLLIENNAVVGFVINYRAKIENCWYAIYRVDTCHNYLHEQRFWISPEPIKLPKSLPLQYTFKFYLEQIKENFERFKQYYKDKLSS
jgi:hypothetical protein